MQREVADPPPLARPGGALYTVATAVSGVVLVAALVFVWQRFHDMAPATLLMWSAMSLLTPTMLHGIGGPPLVLAAGLAAIVALVALPVLLWFSAFRSAIVLALAMTLLGAALASVAWLNPAIPWPGHHRVFADDAMGFLRSCALFDGVALAVWGALTVLLSAAARRAQRVGSSSERRLRLLAAIPTLLVACTFVVIALVGGYALGRRASAVRDPASVTSLAMVSGSRHAALHGHHHGSLRHGEAGDPVALA